MALIWAILGFAVAFGIVLAIASAADKTDQRTRARLRGLMDTPSPAAAPTVSSSRHGKNERLPTIAGIASSLHMTDRLSIELAAAGWAVRPSEFIGIILISMVGALVVSLFVSKSLFTQFVFACAGVAIPVMLMRISQAKMRAAFNNQIIDALEMIASSLRSGSSFIRSIQLVAQEMPPPISTEFRRVVYETNLGRPLEDSLKGVVQRVGSYDFDLVVTAVVVQLQVGGNLADILSTIAQTLRARLQIMGEVNSLTAEGRISALILMLLPIAIGIILTVANPAYMGSLFNDPLGRMAIGVAVVMQVIGGIVMKNMMNLDV